MLPIPEDSGGELGPKLGVALDQVGEVAPLQILPDDSRQGVRLDRMIDDRLRRRDHRRAVGARTKRQIYVLACDRDLVEPLQPFERPIGVEDVAGLRVGPDGIDSHRADVWSGEDGALVRIRTRAPLDDQIRVLRSGNQALEPTGLGSAVVIDEGDELPSGQPPADVALPRGAPRPRLDRARAKPALRAERMVADNPVRVLRVVVVYDYDLPVAAEALFGKRVQQPPEPQRASVRGDHDADEVRLGHAADPILPSVRILTVGNGYPPHHHGGYELVWRAAVEHLRAAGHDVVVLTVGDRTDSDEPDDAGVYRDLRWHLEDGRFKPRGVLASAAQARHNHRALRAQLDRFRPDVVGWWSMGGLSLTMLESVRRRQIPAIGFVHDEWLEYGQWADPWLTKFRGPRRGRFSGGGERLARIPTEVDFGGAASYAFVSEFTRRHALGLGLDLSDTGVIHSAIHPDFTDPAPPRAWNWQLLYVGRIDRRKGIDTAIASLPRLPEAAELAIIGSWDVEEERRLISLASDLGVRERVEFRGRADRAELMDAYARCDAVLFPVRWNEPWGLVPLEAMGRGRPVLASGRGGSAEYLRDGVNCLLAEAEDPDAWADGVKRLADSPSLRDELRRHGFETASRHTEPGFNREVELALEAAVIGAPVFPPREAISR